MNLVIIAEKSGETYRDLVKSRFDDINVTLFKDTELFLKELMLRNMELHRVVLMQDAITNITDERVYAFVDYLMQHYPSIRIITLSKDDDINGFLGELIASPYAVHFKVPPTTKSKVLLDIASKDIDYIKKNYKENIYIRAARSVSDIVEEDTVSQGSTQGKKDKKKGFLSKVFGAGSKTQKEVKTNQKGNIGQGYGTTTEVEEEPEKTDLKFDMFSKEELDIGMGEDVSLDTPDDSWLGDENDFLEVEEDFLEDDDDFLEDDEDFLEEESYKSDPEDATTKEIVNKEEDTSFIEDFEEDSEEEDTFFIEPSVEEDSKSDIDDSFDVGGEDTFDTSGLFEEDSLEPIVQESDLTKERKKIEAVNSLHRLKQELQGKEIVSNLGADIEDGFNTTDEVLDEVEIEDNGLEDLDIDGLMQSYDKTNIKVVEKIIERVVDTGAKKQYRNRNGVRVVIVTGDRRVGCTKLSMNLANLFSKQESTLYIDLDRYRKGSLSYIGVEDIIEEEEHVQNGLIHLKNISALRNLTYYYPPGGFNMLLSMYGEEVSDKDIEKVQNVVYNQKDFSTVIIDCPLENLYTLSDLLYVSNVLLCIEDDKVGIINSVLSLNSAVEEKYMPALYNNSQVVVSRGSNISKYKENILDVVDIFALDETTYNWGDLHIVGTIKGTKGIAKEIGGVV